VILTEVMTTARASGRLTTDAHLAAMAIETQAELHSNDADLARFPGLRWVNPLGV
jgi:predicted nucleic acid-binding protein